MNVSNVFVGHFFFLFLCLALGKKKFYVCCRGLAMGESVKALELSSGESDIQKSAC